MYYTCLYDAYVKEGILHVTDVISLMYVWYIYVNSTYVL